ncbi:hypothetical protein BJ742DRAFT_886978 [Cladochytrium replicatum]|nr:hypothetical protein BJ742DRAFT_886978 [Cladochytrium replicatum]
MEGDSGTWLGDNARRLLHPDESCADFTIFHPNGEFRCHRDVLSRIPYFSALTTHGFSDSSAGSIVLTEDVVDDPATLWTFLLWTYTGELRIAPNDVPIASQGRESSQSLMPMDRIRMLLSLQRIADFLCVTELTPLIMAELRKEAHLDMDDCDKNECVNCTIQLPYLWNCVMKEGQMGAVDEDEPQMMDVEGIRRARNYAVSAVEKLVNMMEVGRSGGRTKFEEMLAEMKPWAVEISTDCAKHLTGRLLRVLLFSIRTMFPAKKKKDGLAAKNGGTSSVKERLDAKEQMSKPAALNPTMVKLDSKSPLKAGSRPSPFKTVSGGTANVPVRTTSSAPAKTAPKSRIPIGSGRVTASAKQPNEMSSTKLLNQPDEISPAADIDSTSATLESRPTSSETAHFIFQDLSTVRQAMVLDQTIASLNPSSAPAVLLRTHWLMARLEELAPSTTIQKALSQLQARREYQKHLFVETLSPKKKATTPLSPPPKISKLVERVCTTIEILKILHDRAVSFMSANALKVLSTPMNRHFSLFGLNRHAKSVVPPSFSSGSTIWCGELPGGGPAPKFAFDEDASPDQIDGLPDLLNIRVTHIVVINTVDKVLRSAPSVRSRGGSDGLSNIAVLLQSLDRIVKALESIPGRDVAILEIWSKSRRRAIEHVGKRLVSFHSSGELAGLDPVLLAELAKVGAADGGVDPRLSIPLFFTSPYLFDLQKAPPPPTPTVSPVQNAASTETKSEPHERPSTGSQLLVAVKHPKRYKALAEAFYALDNAFTFLMKSGTSEGSVVDFFKIKKPVENQPRGMIVKDFAFKNSNPTNSIAVLGWRLAKRKDELMRRLFGCVQHFHNEFLKEKGIGKMQTASKSWHKDSTWNLSPKFREPSFH